MKFVPAAVALVSSLAAAQPLTARQSASDTENGWSAILNGDEGATCSDLAVIFARGTFDPGNIGPWVGAPWRDDLASKHDSVAFQGVNAADYPADLAGYIVEGGSDSCASSLGEAVKTYAAACPNSKIVISGWSQGALCARKSFGSIGDTAEHVIAFITFGDPFSTWSNGIDFPAIPSGAREISLCNSAPTDPLCGKIQDNWPSTPGAVIDHLKEIWGSVSQADMNTEQKAALGSMIKALPVQAMAQLGTLGRDIINGDLRRWMLTPEHFWYGMDGSVGKASDELLGLL